MRRCIRARMHFVFTAERRQSRTPESSSEQTTNRMYSLKNALAQMAPLR